MPSTYRKPTFVCKVGFGVTQCNLIHGCLSGSGTVNLTVLIVLIVQFGPFELDLDTPFELTSAHLN
jgi:hypothetical protein